jgi:hypothetical protein
MTYLYIFFLVLVLVTYKVRGPIFIYSLSWTLSLTPIFFGFIEYTFLDSSKTNYVMIVASASICFITPAFLLNLFYKKYHNNIDYVLDIKTEHFNWNPFARYIMLTALICMLLFSTVIFSNSVNLNDLSSLRSSVVATQGASVIGRLIAVTNWACFFCVLYAFYFYDHMKPQNRMLYMLCGFGIFLSSLTSAGRQSIMQIILLIFFINIFTKSIKFKTESFSFEKILFYSFGILFLIYITVYRSDNGYSIDRTSIILSIFRAKINPELDAFLFKLGLGPREFIVELILYISHSVPLFSLSSEIDFLTKTYGAMTFPFVFRQIEPITGIIVIDALINKGNFINSLNVIGVGWDTSLSSPLTDFGMLGLLAYMAILGTFSHWAWLRAVQSREFGAVVLCSLFMLSAAYSPFLPLFSDTNMFFLLIFSAFLWHRTRRKSYFE